MSLWLIGIIAVAAVVVAIAVIRRNNRAPDRISPDSTTQVAALRVLEANAAANVAATAAAATAGAPIIPTPVATGADSPAGPDGASPAGAPAEAQSQGLNVRVETLRALREIALDCSLPATPAPTADEVCAAVAAALVNIVDKPNYAPRRPMQLPRLMQAINDESASRTVLSQIIAGDPALAGNLLRLANSPFYRHSPEPIESLDRAISMLGTEGLRSMIAAALMQPVFRISGGSFAHFGEVTWEHSLFAANAAENHAGLVESVDPFAAQLLALILGLATIVVFSVSQDAFLGRQRKPDAATIAALIDLHAIGVARQVAASWELSERIDMALGEQAGVQAAAGGIAGSPLGRALQFGEFLGALAVLRTRGALDDQAAAAVLKFIPGPPALTARIWGRLGFMPD